MVSIESAEPFIVAEIGGNHNGSFDRAVTLMRHAARAGADAVKFQCFTPEAMTLDHDGPGFTIDEGPWAGLTLWDLYSKTATPLDWFQPLFEQARNLGLIPFASVFDAAGVDFLETLDCPIYKIASFEVTDRALIRYAASKGKPMIISTGMASLQEIDQAFVAGCNATGSPFMLHCISEYPAQPHGYLKDGVGYRMGISDHTLSTVLPAVATGMGAVVIEKHLCISRAEAGPDVSFSLEPHEFHEMVRNCREAWMAHQPASPRPLPYLWLRRSLYVVADVAEGETLSEAHVKSIRPGFGIAPMYLPDVLGKVATHPLHRGEPLRHEDYE